MNMIFRNLLKIMVFSKDKKIIFVMFVRGMDALEAIHF